MNPWLEPLIAAACAGDDVAARALMGYLAVCLERGETPPVALVGYFAPAFKQIASGRSADSVLNTGGKSATFELYSEIARAVWELNHRTENRLPLRESKSKPGAYTVVGKKYSLSPDRIEQIYKKIRWLVEVEAFEMTLEPGEDREGPKVPVAHQSEWQEARHRHEVDMHIVFAQLTEALKKQGRN